MKHYKLAKLPHWGEMVRPSQINFEWPTQDAFAQMAPSCFLKSLEFKKTADGAVSSVRCTYSDTSGSPAFEKATAEHQGAETVGFEVSKPIKKVTANCDDNDNPWTYVCRLRFLDKADKEIGVYNSECAQEEWELSLRDNEELFGVYGVKDKADHITTFGYIVKVSS